MNKIEEIDREINRILQSVGDGRENPQNATGYSAENLCRFSGICTISKTDSNHFSMYCSGRHNECMYNVIDGRQHDTN